MINKIAHEASAKLLLICSYDCWVNVSDLWLAHGLELMPVPMSTPFRLISPKKLRHKHKHKHEKNKHVRFSCAYAYAFMCQWKPDLSNEDCDRDKNGKKGNRFRPHPHESVFFLNGDFFLRFGLPSTRVRWKQSPKTHLFKKAHQSWDFWKRRLFFYVCTYEYRGFRIRWCHTSKIYHLKIYH